MIKFIPDMDLMKLEELLKFHGKIPTGSGDIWILRGLLGHFDPGMSVKVNIEQFSFFFYFSIFMIVVDRVLQAWSYIVRRRNSQRRIGEKFVRIRQHRTVVYYFSMMRSRFDYCQGLQVWKIFFSWFRKKMEISPAF